MDNQIPPTPVITPQPSKNYTKIIVLVLVVVIVLLLVALFTIPILNKNTNKQPQQSSQVNKNYLIARDSLQEFSKRALKPQYVPPSLKSLIINEGSESIKYGVQAGIPVGGEEIMPVYTESLGHVYWRETISLAKSGLPNKDLPNALALYNQYFNSYEPKNDVADWKTIYNGTNSATFERIVDRDNGSFDSEGIWIIPDGDTGSFKALLSFCNTSNENPSYSKKSCFGN